MADDDFEEFVRIVDPQLRRALSGHLPQEQVADAIAEAFAYPWQQWPRVQAMDNAAGYLFRVAQSKSRARKELYFPMNRTRGPCSRSGKPGPAARWPHTLARSTSLSTTRRHAPTPSPR